MNTKKALIVDDEIHVVQVIAIKFRNAGFKVFTASNGKEALELAISEKPNVIVTDLIMPVMDGRELVENIRKDPNIQDTPIILLVPRGYIDRLKWMESLNISNWLTKPFSPREVLKMATEALEE
jgi:CheY-like chemotaxis protein